MSESTKTPDMIVYSVVEGKKDKNYWTQLSAA